VGARKNEKGLTIMSQRFCYEYVADPEGNATRAAIRAGYSETSAHVKASNLLDQPAVQKEIDRLTRATMYKLGINALTVAREIKKIASANVCDYGRINEKGEFEFDLTTSTRDQMSAVQEISSTEWETGDGENKTVHRRTKLKLFPKLPANELLTRATAGFSQKHEHSGPGGGPVHFTLERIGAAKRGKDKASA
jgi:phage terminase small subunit